jgi:hypothetical protein
VRPSHGRPRGHRLTVRASVIVDVTTLVSTSPNLTSRLQSIDHESGEAPAGPTQLQQELLISDSSD